MKKLALLLLPFLFLGFALLQKKSATAPSAPKATSSSHPLSIRWDGNETALFEEYVFLVIKHGSKELGFPTQMEGGYVNDEEARKIAAYLATLQGYSPSHPEWVEEGAALYHGNCTGCHQPGLKSFPDLTKKPLLGIARLKNRVQ